MKLKWIFLLPVVLLLAAVDIASARTWTDAASGRILDGDYLKSDATHVTIRSGGKTLKIAIARLSEVDQNFVKEQIAEAANPSVGLKTVIPSPFSIKPLPVKGQGDDRRAGLEVINNGDKAISKLEVKIALPSGMPRQARF